MSDSEEVEEEATKTYKIKKDAREFANTQQDKKQSKQLSEAAREKLLKSDLYKSLRREVDDAPEELGGSTNRVEKFRKEIDQRDEDNMIRTVVSKRKIQELKRKDRRDDNIMGFSKEFRDLDRILGSGDDVLGKKRPKGRKSRK